MTSSLVLQMLAGAQQSNPNSLIVHFSGSQTPAKSSKSQLDQQLSLHYSSKSA
jgi:hypothetical protein